MSWPLFEAARSSAALGARDRFVLLILAQRANEKAICWPSVGSIAADTDLSVRAVQKALRCLREAGHISVEGNARGGGHHATPTYRIHPVPCPVRVAKMADRRRQRDDAKQDDGNGERTRGAPMSVACPTRQPDTPRVQKVRPTGAGDAPHGCTPCTQTFREKKEKTPENPQQGGGVLRSYSESDKNDRTGPVSVQTILDFCLTESIPGEAGKACFAEWQESGWCLDGERIRDWRKLLVNRRDNGRLPRRADDSREGRPPASPAHWEEPTWDWKALFYSQYDFEPDKPWSHYGDDIQKELNRLHKKNKERAALPAPQAEMEAWVRDTYPHYDYRDHDWFSYPSDDRISLIRKYEASKRSASQDGEDSKKKETARHNEIGQTEAS